MKLLHIIATPRTYESNTLRIATAYLESLRDTVADLHVETLDLFSHQMPTAVGDNIAAKYSLMARQPIQKRHQTSWRQIELLIEQFLAADRYLLTIPMWNLSIPYVLKYYIDSIVQPGYLFEWTETGQPIGLVEGKKMVCIVTHGGDYATPTAGQTANFLEPYLRAIFGMIGIIDIQFITAQPMDVTPALRETAVTTAITEARRLAANLA